MNEKAEEPLELVDLGQLHEGIIAAIRQRFGGRLKTVAMYDPVDPELKDIRTPAVLLELAEIHPAGRVSGGRTPIELGFTAHCMLSTKTESVQLEVRNFAVQIMRLVDGNRWGLGEFADRAEGLEAFPGIFSPGEKGFESWVVNWKQTVHLGDVWELPGDVMPGVPGEPGAPAEVYLGMAPDIGLAHRDKYERVG